MSLNITDANANKLPDHLGGHLNKTHVDYGALDYLHEKYKFETMVDVGCGTGGMVDYAYDIGIRALGIDGDFTLKRKNPCMIHDFTGDQATWPNFDLGWSVEFLEHVEEQYMDNYFVVFIRCKYVIVTYAPPGWNGHHHVNLQEESYWIDKFKFYHFTFDEAETKMIREKSTMVKGFMGRTGLFFVNENYEKNIV